MIVLDNKATATSGFQPHPGVAKDATGRKTPALDMAQIALACGVKNIHTVDKVEIDSTLKDTFCKEDSHIWRETAEKRWAYLGSVIIFE